MKSIFVVLNLISAVFASAAALCWLKVALIEVPPTMGLTADMTNFNWLTQPLTQQGEWNGLAARFAVIAALAQGAAAVVNAKRS
jgi:hypothetical protein